MAVTIYIAQTANNIFVGCVISFLIQNFHVTIIWVRHMKDCMKNRSQNHSHRKVKVMSLI